MQTVTFRPLLTARTALRALRRNKMRSILTALGIIIGVASVVAMVAVGNGAQANIESQVAALGQNVLTVFATNRRTSGVNSGLGSAGTLTIADAQAIAREIQEIAHVSPEVSTTAQALANGRNWSTTVSGEGEDYLAIRDWPLASGAMFTEREVKAAARVAVIGATTANQLFGPADPLGQTVRVKGFPFVIIGVLSAKGAGMGGMDQDDRLVVPYTTVMKRLTGAKYLRAITLQVGRSDEMDLAEAQVTSLLRQRHRLPADSDSDFRIMNQKEIADTVGSISKVITLLLGSIAGMSLVVGGIGIMNIMLVSVTERTREIGIRVAVGAKSTDIMLQFLIEAVTLSVLGGLLGVLIGVGASACVHFFANFKAVVSSGSVILAFGVSVAIGVFFGFYPARKASRLDPIDALRYE